MPNANAAAYSTPTKAALLDLDELTRRTAALTTRRPSIAAEHTELMARSAELATDNRLRHGLAASPKAYSPHSTN